MRVAEQTSNGVAVGDLGGVGFVGRVGVVAGRILLLAAEEALPAGDDERHHHLLPDLQTIVHPAVANGELGFYLPDVVPVPAEPGKDWKNDTLLGSFLSPLGKRMIFLYTKKELLKKKKLKFSSIK